MGELHSPTAADYARHDAETARRKAEEALAMAKAARDIAGDYAQGVIAGQKIERERCAKIADLHAEAGDLVGNEKATAAAIAAEIRSGA
jgi:hypothetical protein